MGLKVLLAHRVKHEGAIAVACDMKKDGTLVAQIAKFTN